MNKVTKKMKETYRLKQTENRIILGIPELKVPSEPAGSLEFCRWVESGRGQISFAPVREADCPKTTLSICLEALDQIQTKTPETNECTGPYLFMGCVDCLIGPNGELTVCETNGLSSRGLHILSLGKFPEVDHLFYHYYKGQSTPTLLLEARAGILQHLPQNPTILIAIKTDDSLKVDAFGRAKMIVEKAQETGNHPTVIINEYGRLFDPKKQNLWAENQKVFYLDQEGKKHKINGITDGAFRRMPKKVQEDYHQGKLDLLVANPSYQLTDDKALTGEVFAKIGPKLKPFGAVVLQSIQVNENDYLEPTEEFMGSLGKKKSCVIKPWAGSGGVGIAEISDIDQIETVFQESRQKVQNSSKMKGRTGFPYTVQEKFNVRRVVHHGKPGYFCDLRVYVVRVQGPKGKDIIIPAGFLNRVSKDWITNLSKKEEEGGGVDMSRGYGTKYIEMFGGHDVYVRAAVISCALMAAINNSYQQGKSQK